MAYETGAATGQHDLLDKVRTFLVANGWTQNGWAADGTGQRLHVSKGGLYFNFRSANNERVFGAYFLHTDNAFVTGIALCGSTGYNGGEDWDKQPGGPQTASYGRSWGVCLKGVSGAIPAYHLFTLGDNSACLIVEYQAGKYQWLVWGELDAADAGTYTGGQFVAGSRSAALASYETYPDPLGPFGWFGDVQGCPLLAVRLDVDSVTEYWWAGSEDVSYGESTTRIVRAMGLSAYANTGFTPPTSSTYQIGLLAPLIRSTPNSFNGLTPLFPIQILAERDSDRFSYIGRIPNFRTCNMAAHSPGDEETWGGDTWKIFPQHSLSDTNPETGYAVLKVT